MKPESFINKLQPDPDGLDFEALRQEGLRLVQEMSGDIWSDYNLHDPGVTILEQLCYGLTDAAYRCDFPAADYLTSADGRIDFARLALYRPEEVLPSAPLTDADYRKLVLSSVPNVENVWVECLRGEFGGLYRIYVLLDEQVKNQSNNGVRKAYADIIGGIYAANRNLCEDIESVRIVERKPYSLRGEIEIDGRRDPSSVLAEIYAECAHYLCPRISVDSYAELYKDGRSMEQIFTGVTTGQGYIPDDALHAWRGQFSIAELIGIITQIKGVENITQLAFVGAGEDETSVIELGSEQRFRTVACLAFPEEDGEIRIGLYKAGRSYRVSLADLTKESGRLNFSHHALRQRKLRFDWVQNTLPVGIHRELHEYHSVQNHFPDTYGLNNGGVPNSAGLVRQAQALQLKAYVLMFEQVVANFLRNVQEIPALFSIDETLAGSYFYQVLGNDSVPGVESLYCSTGAQLDDEMAALVAGIDDFGDRRNRVLDYLLALYGEKFSQNSLRNFFQYDADPETSMIRNKRTFLRDMVALGRNRATAINYRKPANAENVPGLKRKLALLLGLDTSTSGGDFHLVEHILLRPGADNMQMELKSAFYGFRISIVFPAAEERWGDSGFRKLAEETVYMNCPAHIHPQLLWLDTGQMQRFNALYGKWLGLLHTRHVADAGAVSAELAAFLREHGERAHG